MFEDSLGEFRDDHCWLATTLKSSPRSDLSVPSLMIHYQVNALDFRFLFAYSAGR